ncbi:hypothetical protein NPIL_494291 [Nephila pilipes]|uniref:C3H1-type domain-containing protein n=1 Tax=Nephila pilipes TaxID=299642 RepID=A0A8X6NW55_NEPPI|nr:hypothetical protein NPIL_494291 [Nephila pilipes]
MDKTYVQKSQSFNSPVSHCVFETSFGICKRQGCRYKHFLSRPPLTTISNPCVNPYVWKKKPSPKKTPKREHDDTENLDEWNTRNLNVEKLPPTKRIKLNLISKKGEEGRKEKEVPKKKNE